VEVFSIAYVSGSIARYVLCGVSCDAYRMCLTSEVLLPNIYMCMPRRRRKDDLFTLPCNMQNNFNNIGIRVLNQFPQSIKEIPVLYKFKKTLRTYLIIVSIV
jgi:hypothetical protein